MSSYVPPSEISIFGAFKYLRMIAPLVFSSVLKQSSHSSTICPLTLARPWAVPPPGRDHAVAGSPHTKQMSRLTSSPGSMSKNTRPSLISTMSPSLVALRRSRLFIVVLLRSAYPSCFEPLDQFAADASLLTQHAIEHALLRALLDGGAQDVGEHVGRERLCLTGLAAEGAVVGCLGRRCR